MISLNGSAARRAQLGDLVIIAAFALVDEIELKRAGSRTSCSSMKKPHQGKPRSRAERRTGPDQVSLAQKRPNKAPVAFEANRRFCWPSTISSTPIR